MFKVILVMPYNSNPVGGIENVAYNIVEGLVKLNKKLDDLGIQVTVLSDVFNGYINQEVLNDYNINIINYSQPGIPILTNDINNLIIITLLKRLMKSAQVVHSHNILFTLPLVLYSKEFRIIHNFHGLPWNEFKSSPNSLTKISYKMLDLRFRLLSLLPSVEYVAISNYVLKEVKAKLGIDENKIHLIPDTISEEFFRIKKKEEPGVIFYPARLIPRKNHLTLLKALYILKKEGLKDFKLILTGRCEDEKYFNLLLYAINKYNLNRNVIMRGIVNRDELKLLYSKASIVVVPSFEESFSLVIAEAMATGTPVISTPTGLAADHIIDFRNGFIVNGLNPYELAEKVRMLMEDDNLRRRIGIEAKETARKWVSYNVAEKLVELWLGLK